MSPDPAVELARVRKLCLALPRAAEKLSHGTPAFYVEKGKTFAHFCHDHHGDGRTAVWLRTSGRDEQAMLIEADPRLYFVPPYVGASGWIGMRLDGDDPDWERVSHRIVISHELAAAPRRR